MVDLKRLMFDKSLSQRDLAQIIGTAQSEISHFANGRRDLKGPYLQSLIAHFGKEVIDSYTIPDTPVVPQVQQATVTIFDPNTLQSVKDDIKEEESIPVVPEDILCRRELDIFDFIQQNGSELENVDPRELVGEASFCLRVLKDSMAPDIMQGDVVFCQFLPKNAKLHSGGIYFIDTPLYAGVIRDVIINGNIMTLKARNPKYGDIILDLTKDKYRAANLKGSFRNTFSSAFSQMQNVYKKKDEQIDKILEQQGRLIDFITKDK